MKKRHRGVDAIVGLGADLTRAGIDLAVQLVVARQANLAERLISALVLSFSKTGAAQTLSSVAQLLPGRYNLVWLFWRCSWSKVVKPRLEPRTPLISCHDLAISRCHQLRDLASHDIKSNLILLFILFIPSCQFQTIIFHGYLKYLLIL